MTHPQDCPGVSMKTCVACGVELVQRPTEWPSHYAKRTCCTTACANAVRNAIRSAEEEAARAALAEDVEWLIGTDRPDNIARRLGYTQFESLTRRLYRAGRPDLVARLDRAREAS